MGRADWPFDACDPAAEQRLGQHAFSAGRVNWIIDRNRLGHFDQANA
jgi:hypothetical protein